MTTGFVGEHAVFYHAVLTGIDSCEESLARAALDTLVRRHQPHRTDDNPVPVCSGCRSAWPCRDFRSIAESLRISSGDATRVVRRSAPPGARRIRGEYTLTYSVPAEAFYAGTLAPSELRCIDVQASSDLGGVAWEFSVYEADLGRSTVGVRLFTGAFQALADIPDFFEALREEEPGTKAEVRAILDRVGAWDKTSRVNPRG